MLEIRPITHVIFDFDGVIMDSEKPYAVANAMTLERYGVIYTPEMRSHVQGRRMDEGVRSLLEVSGLDKKEFAIKRVHCEHLISKMSHLVAAGSDPDVKTGKPSPDPYLVTMKRFKTRPESPKNVLIFEDSVSGVKSVLAAGCTVCWIPQKDLLPYNFEDIKKELEQYVDQILFNMEYVFPERYGFPKMEDLKN